MLDSATFVAGITRSLNTGRNNFLGNPLGVRGQADEAHEVYEGGGEVELAAKLTGGVVEGECVMVVVEAFSCSTESHQRVFPRVDGLVIRPVAPYVSGAVDQPGGVEDHSVPQEPRYEVSHSQGLTPEVPGDQHRQKEAKDHH